MANRPPREGVGPLPALLLDGASYLQLTLPFYGREQGDATMLTKHNSVHQDSMEAIVQDEYGYPMSWNSGTSAGPRSKTTRY